MIEAVRRPSVQSKMLPPKRNPDLLKPSKDTVHFGATRTDDPSNLNLDSQLITLLLEIPPALSDQTSTIKQRPDFLALIKRQKDPIKTAQWLQNLISMHKPDPDNPEPEQWNRLYALINRYPLETLVQIQQVTSPLESFNRYSFRSLSRIMNLMEAVAQWHEQYGVSFWDLKQITDRTATVFEQSHIYASLPETLSLIELSMSRYFSVQKAQPSLLGELLTRFPTVHKVMKYLPSFMPGVKSHPNCHLALPDYHARILKRMAKLTDFVHCRDSDFIATVYNMLRTANSLTEFNRTVDKFSTEYRSAKADVVKSELLSIYRNIDDPATQTAAISLAHSLSPKLGHYSRGFFHSQPDSTVREVYATEAKLQKHLSGIPDVLSRYPDSKERSTLEGLMGRLGNWQKFDRPFSDILSDAMLLYENFNNGNERYSSDDELRFDSVTKILADCNTEPSLQKAVAQSRDLKNILSASYSFPQGMLKVLKETGNIERAQMYQMVENKKPQGDGYYYEYSNDSRTIFWNKIQQWVADEKQPLMFGVQDLSRILEAVEKSWTSSNHAINLHLLENTLKGTLSPDAFLALYRETMTPFHELNGPVLENYRDCVTKVFQDKSMSEEEISLRIRTFYRLCKTWMTTFKDEQDFLIRPLFSMFALCLKDVSANLWEPYVQELTEVCNTMPFAERNLFDTRDSFQDFKLLFDKTIEFHHKHPGKGRFKDFANTVLQWSRTPPPMIPFEEWVLSLGNLLVTAADKTDLKHKQACLRQIGTPGNDIATRNRGWQGILSGHFAPEQIDTLIPMLEGFTQVFPGQWQFLRETLAQPALSKLSAPQIRQLFVHALRAKEMPKIIEITRLDRKFSQNPELLRMMCDFLLPYRIQYGFNKKLPHLDELVETLSRLTQKEIPFLDVNEVRVLMDFFYEFRKTVPDLQEAGPICHLLDFMAERVPSAEWIDFARNAQRALAAIPREEIAVFESSGSKTLLNTVMNRWLEVQPRMPAMGLLENVLNNYAFLKRSAPTLDVTFLLSRMIRRTETLKGFNQHCQPLRILLEETREKAERDDALNQLNELFDNRYRFSPDSLALVRQYLDAGGSFARLLPFMKNMGEMKFKYDSLDFSLKLFLSGLLEADQKPHATEFAQALPGIIQSVNDAIPSHPELLQTVLKDITALPNQWQEAASYFKSVFSEMDFSKCGDADWYQVNIASHPAKAVNVAHSLKLLTLLAQPNRFMNEYLLHQDQIDPDVIDRLFHHIEFSNRNLGRGMLPELLAMLTPYLSHSHRTSSGLSQHMERVNHASASLTSLYDFIGKINTLEGIALNTWAKVGTLGLSFTKWQYDSMRLWKGAGPSEKASLLMQSGMFKPTPPRSNDKVYHGGYYRYDSATGVCIELRRAYIVISKPGLGTLVIRNSSPVFGRDLLKEPAYYSPDKLYTEGANLLNPDIDLSEHFKSVLGLEINREGMQTENHTKLQALLQAFDDTMAPYVDWKCGFKGGTPPAGFREMVRLSLMSAKNNGAMSPFGKKKNIRLAWVNPQALPLSVSSFNASDPALQKELELYLNLADKKMAITTPEEYDEKLPNLMAFLKSGLADNLELVLTETQSH